MCRTLQVNKKNKSETKVSAYEYLWITANENNPRKPHPRYFYPGILDTCAFLVLKKGEINNDEEI